MCDDDLDKLAAAIATPEEGEDDDARAKRLADMREKLSKSRQRISGVWKTVAKRGVRSR